MASGFTLVELVVVISILAIVATVGIGRFASTSPFAGRAAADQLAAALRGAQRLAVAQRSTLYVQVQGAPAAVHVCLDIACAQPLAPSDGGAWIAVQGGTRFDASANYSIDALGRPSLVAAQSFTPIDEAGVASGPPVRVEAESGLVRVMTP